MKFPLTIRTTFSALLVIVYIYSASTALAGEEESESSPNISLVYSSDFLRNQSGGLQTGSAYIDYATVALSHQIQLNNDIEMRFLGSALYANGAKFSETIVGDSQGASSSEAGVNIKRIYEAYIDISTGNHSVLLGFFDTNTEFDVIDSAGLFVNSAYGMGNTLGSSGRNGPSTYPFPGFSLRYQYAAEHYTIRTVVTDGVPGDADNANKLGLNLSSNEGYLNIVEFEYRQPQTKWLAGIWHYDESVSINESAKPNNNGMYLRAEHAFADAEGLIGFARIGTASSATNVFEQFYSAGLVQTGFFESRSEDQIGLAFAFAKLSSMLKVDGSINTFNTASGELNIELSYSAKINDWLILQPSFQWIKNPSAQNIDSASIIGVRLTIEL
jgi:porin